MPLIVATGAPSGHPPTRDPEAPPEIRQDYAQFYDGIQRADTTIGALLDLLTDSELANDTLVLFTSDNGIAFPYGKTTLYELGIHMPLIARWPGVIEPGRSTEQFASFVDFLPTCLDLAGVPVPAELPGLSLTPVLSGSGKLERDAVLGSHNDHREGPTTPSRSVRIANWKYIRNFRPDLAFTNGVMLTTIAGYQMIERAKQDEALARRLHNYRYRPPIELFDLAQDPYEQQNLAEVAQHAPQLARLEARLKDFMKSIDDPLLADW